MQQNLIAGLGIAMLLVALGCARKDADDKNTGNPITNAKGDIGQGGDAAAMAARRAAQQQTAMNDLKTIGQLFGLHKIDVATPTTVGFRRSIEEAKDLPAHLCTAVKEGQYVIQVPPGGSGILAYEKDRDYQNTRVVVMTDGSVTKTMPEADFQVALKKGQ